MRKRIVYSVLAIWIFFWILFFARGLYKGNLRKYRALLSRSAEARISYIIGAEFHSFLKEAMDMMLKDATYRIASERKPIDRYRIIYYLYPRKISNEPDYNIYYKGGQYILRKL